MESHLQTDLLDFLKDIDCLNALSPWTRGVNIFNVLKLARTEIRHSNMLAWLLDPNGNHGLGASILYGFLSKLPNRLPAQASDNMSDIDFLSLLTSDISSFQIRREWKNIDILLVSQALHTIIAIENKIDSGLGKRPTKKTQLDDYDAALKKAYKNGWQWARVLLSPNQARFEDETIGTWGLLEYSDFIDILDRSLQTNSKTLSPEASVLINNYMDLLKNEITMDNDDLIRICNEIYKNHKSALDLIFDNRYDLAQPVAEICHEWIQTKTDIELDEKGSRKKFFKFRSTKLKQYFSGAGDPQNYYYQIAVFLTPSEETVKIQFALVFYKDASGFDEKMKEKVNCILKHAKGGSKKQQTCDDINVWKTVKSYTKEFDALYYDKGNKTYDNKDAIQSYLNSSFVSLESIIPNETPQE